MQADLEAVLDGEEERARKGEAAARQLGQAHSQVTAMEAEVASAAEVAQVGAPLPNEWLQHACGAQLPRGRASGATAGFAPCPRLPHDTCRCCGLDSV